MEGFSKKLKGKIIVWCENDRRVVFRMNGENIHVDFALCKGETIYDDLRENNMELESANAFYKYQILDTETLEPIYSAENKGKECIIDKSKIAAGNYNIRLYTSRFVITSKITVSGKSKLNTMADLLKTNKKTTVGITGETNSSARDMDFEIEVTADLEVTANPL